MAKTAGFDLLAQSRRCEIPLRIAGLWIDPPRDVAALIVVHGETLGLVVMFTEWPPPPLRAAVALVMECGSAIKGMNMTIDP